MTTQEEIVLLERKLSLLKEIDALETAIVARQSYPRWVFPAAPYTPAPWVNPVIYCGVQNA